MKIAVTGKMCSGKTTLCNYLCELEPRFEIFSFGKKVKQVASDLFGMDPLYKDRTLLTGIGQKMREIDSEVWINYVINQCSDKEFCLVDDLRYQNEYEALIKNGFKNLFGLGRSSTGSTGISPLHCAVKRLRTASRNTEYSASVISCLYSGFFMR